MNDRGAGEYAAIEGILGYTFRDKALLETAFTHSSYAYAAGVKSNERLEFLGDAVLQLAVTEALLAASDRDEGALTELRKQYVSRPALEQAEARAGLMPFLRHTGGEENIGGKTASNLFEAVIGAIYLDGGAAPVKRFLAKYLLKIKSENYKTVLQEYVQERDKTTPRYETREEAGEFVCTVTALAASASGKGPSKKAAETAAAKALCGKLIKGEYS